MEEVLYSMLIGGLSAGFFAGIAMLIKLIKYVIKKTKGSANNEKEDSEETN